MDPRSAQKWSLSPDIVRKRISSSDTHSISSRSVGTYYPFTTTSLDNKEYSIVVTTLFAKLRADTWMVRFCHRSRHRDRFPCSMSECLCTIHFQYPFFVTRTSTMCSVSEEYGGYTKTWKSTYNLQTHVQTPRLMLLVSRWNREL